MSTNSIITHPPANGQPSLQARQFCLAFLPPKEPDTQLMSEQATAAIRALIDFRSAAHRWQAAQHVHSGELAQEMERLHAAGLGCWLDDLLSLVMDGAR